MTLMTLREAETVVIRLMTEFHPGKMLDPECVRFSAVVLLGMVEEDPRCETWARRQLELNG